MRAAPDRHSRDPRLDPLSPERVALRAMLRYDPDDPTEPALPPRPARAGARGIVVLALGLVEAGAVATALLAGSLFQVSSPAIALPAQERLVSAFTELDSLVEVRRADLEGQVERGAPVIAISDLPIAAAVPREEAVGADGTLDEGRLTAALRAGAAAERYADASDDLAGAAADPVFAGLSRTLTADTLSSARTGFVAAGAVALALAVVLTVIGGRRGWVALGVATVAGGLLAAGAAWGTGWALTEAGNAGALRTVELSVVGALLDVPLRNGLIAGAAGLAIALGGLVGPRRSAR